MAEKRSVLITSCLDAQDGVTSEQTSPLSWATMGRHVVSARRIIKRAKRWSTSANQVETYK